jgi:hypothetical protein
VSRDDSDPRRDAIHEKLQELGPHQLEKAAVLTGFVLVCEWMDEDGERWLSKCHSSSLTNWTASGLHHEALYGNWPDGADDDGNEG